MEAEILIICDQVTITRECELLPQTKSLKIQKKNIQRVVSLSAVRETREKELVMIQNI